MQRPWLRGGEERGSAAVPHAYCCTYFDRWLLAFNCAFNTCVYIVYCICETVVVSYSRSIISKKEHTGVRTERSGRPVVDARAVFAARVGCTRGEPHARSSPVVIILRHAPPNSPGTRPISLQHHLPTRPCFPRAFAYPRPIPGPPNSFMGSDRGGGGAACGAKKHYRPSGLSQRSAPLQ